MKDVAMDWARTPWPWPEIGPMISAELHRLATEDNAHATLLTAGRRVQMLRASLRTSVERGE